MGWMLFLGLFFAVFVAAVWRMSSGPTNEEPAIGHNLPSSSTTLSQYGPFPLSTGPEPGTPESLGPSEVDRALEAMEHEHHRRKFDEERHN